MAGCKSLAMTTSSGRERFLSSSQSRSAGVGPILEEELDSKIWSELPEHLVESVLVRLPFWSILAFRSVCKRWRALSSTREFLKLCDRCGRKELMFLIFTDYGVSGGFVGAYEASSNRWVLLRLERISHESGLIVAGAGGLLCMDPNDATPRRSFLITNFLTGRCCYLPPLGIHCYIAGMAFYSPSNYKVLAIAEDEDQLISCCYDSRTRLWQPWRSFDHMIDFIDSTVLLGSTFYCLTSGPTGLLAYDIEKDTWRVVPASMPPSLTCSHLFQHNGQLLLVGGLAEYGALKSIHIWELKPDGESGSVWVEALKMPINLFQKLFPQGEGHFNCVGQNGFICFCVTHSPINLMCDLNAHQWRWLPPCPLDYTFQYKNPTMRMDLVLFTLEPHFDQI